MKIAMLCVCLGVSVGGAAVFWPQNQPEQDLKLLDAVDERGGAVFTNTGAVARNTIQSSSQGDETRQMLRVLNSIN